MQVRKKREFILQKTYKKKRIYLQKREFISSKSDWLCELLHCPMCIGFWVGVFLCGINKFTELFNFDCNFVVIQKEVMEEIKNLIRMLMISLHPFLIFNFDC